MEDDNGRTHRINQYLDKKMMNADKNWGWAKIGLCLLFYAMTLYLEQQSRPEANINGIIAQIQVLISVFMVVSIIKKGYIAAVIVNIFGSLFAVMAVLRSHNLDILPGVITPLCTILIITIISLFGRRLNKRMSEVLSQKEEIVRLFEELSDTEEELSRQNEQLIDYNQVMKENEEKLNFMAYYDTLTELPNRKMITGRLDYLISQSNHKDARFAVVFIDLDNFKRINDSMGHHVGDLLLQAVVSRLKGLIRSGDILGRLGGDEFAMIIQSHTENHEIYEYVEKLRTSLVDPFIVERTELGITASFGISIYPQDGNDSAELLKFSDTAMYKAKEMGKNLVQFFSREMKDEVIRKIQFEHRLLSSVQNHEIFLVFQPQYSSENKELRGFETLVRWKSHELGLVNPGTFIPVAEETRFIIPLGEWILRTACREIKSIQDRYDRQFILAVNLSAVQIMEPTFVHMLKSVLEETGFEAKYLEIEITESVFISSMEYVVKVLNELKENGIHIALDDFGTGYSSLNYIQQLPIDTLKIDKSFVDTIFHAKSKKHIIGSIISLVHKMDIAIIAEGVETEAQLQYLKAQNCDFIQGFLLGKPLDETELNRLLQEDQDSADCRSVLP